MNFSQKCKTGQFLSYKVNGDKTVEVSQDRDNKPTGKLEIPASVTYKGKEYAVTSIGFWAFSSCSGLTSITIPNSVTSIGEEAFSYCEGLTSITIGASVTSIGVGAFRGCEELTSITIPNSVTSIGEEAFCGCSRLTEITIPDSVTSIGFWAFKYCTGLTSITIPNSVTSIGVLAFSYCTGLTSVSIPNSVTSIGVRAFDNCTELTSIDVAADNPNYKSIDGVLYDKDVTTFICCPAGKQGSITIPNSVTSIGVRAFYECKRLTSITIPNSVTSIGDWAFNGCKELKEITCEAVTPPTMDKKTFDCYEIPLYVPAASVEAYKTADYWEEFKDIKPLK